MIHENVLHGMLDIMFLVADYQERMFLLFFTEHYQMSVLESAPISSTVGRVFAKDLDEGINAEMKYTIVDGDGADTFDINTDPNFQVGIITVKKVILFPFPNHFQGHFACETLVEVVVY